MSQNRYVTIKRGEKTGKGRTVAVKETSLWARLFSSKPLTTTDDVAVIPLYFQTSSPAQLRAAAVVAAAVVQVEEQEQEGPRALPALEGSPST